jgi:hypothetical protein
MCRTVGARRIGEGVLLGTWLVIVLAALLGAVVYTLFRVQIA